MSPAAALAGAVAASYLVGSLPFGYWMGRLRGLDIRRTGSGNIGATNALRVLGVRAGVTVLILDAAKGSLAAWLGLAVAGPWGAVATGLGAMAGHNWSLFLGFRGGRGVATGLGVILVLTPRLAAVVLSVFVLTVAATRYVSLGSLLGSLAMLLLVFATAQPVPYRLLVAAGAAFIWYRHRPNIARLLAGTEHRLGARAGAAPDGSGAAAGTPEAAAGQERGNGA